MNLEIGQTIYRKRDGVEMKVVTQGAGYKGMRSWACSWINPKTDKIEEDVFFENELTEDSTALK